MKYRDPKTGEVFEKIEDARRAYCLSEKSKCSKCLFPNCVKYSHDAPAEAARLMGYEVIDDSSSDYSTEIDETPTDTPTTLDDTPTEKSVKQKPRLAEVLGVEVGETFKVEGVSVRFFIGEDGMPKIYDGDSGLDVEGMDIYKAINHPDRIVRAPRLTEPEIAIMRAVGAKWVSRDDDSVIVRLWDEKPERCNGKHETPFACVGTIIPRLFPSVKPGDLIEAGEENDNI